MSKQWSIKATLIFMKQGKLVLKDSEKTLLSMSTNKSMFDRWEAFSSKTQFD